MEDSPLVSLLSGVLEYPCIVPKYTCLILSVPDDDDLWAPANCVNSDVLDLGATLDGGSDCSCLWNALILSASTCIVVPMIGSS